ncbi:non-ltr retroelement reverse transcriptase [Senna tora]|uniref:Non-ltr retroelement reverse transcriptase n=1 Tax=Senna tora TaxID=362788 RepID=A0A834T7B5_9FABA|nr:non-ltr retroelement reverse transcriptase [Senna tora]
MGPWLRASQGGRRIPWEWGKVIEAGDNYGCNRVKNKPHNKINSDVLMQKLKDLSMSEESAMVVKAIGTSTDDDSMCVEITNKDTYQGCYEECLKVHAEAGITEGRGLMFGKVEAQPVKDSKRALWILRSPSKTPSRKKRIFRFEQMWTTHEECVDIIKDSWREGNLDDSSRAFSRNLKGMAKRLSFWNHDTFGHVGRKTKKLQSDLSYLRS